MNSNSDLVLGIDCSTTSLKAIVWDRQGSPVAEGRSELPMLRPRPAWHEQPALAWWEAAQIAIRGAVSSLDTKRLAGLCIAHQRETFVPVDEAGQPLRHALLWMDERARPLLPGLQAHLGGESFLSRTGKVLSGNLAVGKIAWLREYEPEVFARTRWYLDVHAYLVHRLTGLFRTAWGSADPMGLFDMQRNDWAGDVLDAIGVRLEQLPAAFPSGEVIGEVGMPAAQACGLPDGLPVVSGLGDGQAGGLGAGVIRPGAAYLNLGSAVVSGTCSADYQPSPAFRTVYAGVPGMYSLETVILGGTYTITWFLDRFARDLKGQEQPAEELLEEAAAQVPPGALGLILVPYWNSAMDPYWDAAASGVVVGWRGIHGREHFYRAILEGIAFEQRLQTLGVEDTLGKEIERLIVMGGGARSRLWCQILADVIGKPIQCLRASEATALGAGILAAGALGLFPDVYQAAEAMTAVLPEVFEPDLKRAVFYRELFEEVYRPLFPSVQTLMGRLTELVERGGNL